MKSLTDKQARDQAAREYRRIRARSHAPDLATFDSAVAALLAYSTDDPTPAEWVAAAKRVSFPCRRCAGTGKYITGTVNGKPTGPGGICYRCGGAGVRMDADQKRNTYYDTHRLVRLY